MSRSKSQSPVEINYRGQSSRPPSKSLVRPSTPVKIASDRSRPSSRDDDSQSRIARKSLSGGRSFSRSPERRPKNRSRSLSRSLSRSPVRIIGKYPRRSKSVSPGGRSSRSLSRGSKRKRSDSRGHRSRSRSLSMRRSHSRRRMRRSTSSPRIRSRRRRSWSKGRVRSESSSRSRRYMIDLLRSLFVCYDFLCINIGTKN